MADLMTSFLRCYYAGVGPLYLTRWRDTGYTQDLARYRPWGIAGQHAQAHGQAVRKIDGEMVFLEDLGNYPGTLTELQRFLASNVTPQAFVHPQEGQIYGFITEWSVQHEAGRRNSCVATFAFEEVKTSDLTLNAAVLKELTRDTKAQARDYAAQVDTAWSVLGLDLPEPVRELGGFAAALDADVAAAMDALSEAAGLMGLDAQNAEVYQAAIGAVAVTMNPPIDSTLLYELSEDATALEIAVRAWGDGERAVDVMALNPRQRAFFKRGEVVTLYDR